MWEHMEHERVFQEEFCTTGVVNTLLNGEVRQSLQGLTLVHPKGGPSLRTLIQG